MEYDLKKYLPTTKKEMELRGWEEVDIVFFTGDAYVDHPSFGAAVLGRVLEAAGYKVAIVPQPDFHGDFRDFKKFGKPRIYFAVSAGSMDSMVNHYTAAKRRRSDDAYTPDGRAGMRPDYCTITYCKILKQLYPDVPVIIGGIEASMRRLTHYDYWQDKLMPSILVDSGADLLVYGMGEQAMTEIADRIAKGERRIVNVPQTAFLTSDKSEIPVDAIMLASHEEALRDKRKHAENFRLMEIESNKIHQTTLVQPVGKKWVVVNPSYLPMTTEQLESGQADRLALEGIDPATDRETKPLTGLSRHHLRPRRTIGEYVSDARQGHESVREMCPAELSATGDLQKPQSRFRTADRYLPNG